MRKRLIILIVALSLVLAGAVTACVFLPLDRPAAAPVRQSDSLETEPSVTLEVTEPAIPETSEPAEAMEPPQTQPTQTIALDSQTQPEEADAPTEPEPTQPKPTEPKPTQPKPTEATQPAVRKLTAKNYFVYDCGDSAFTVLSGKKDDRIYPASITKLFTAYVALQSLDSSTIVTAGNELDLVSANSSVAWIQKGYRLTVEMLVEGMLLPSGCDAAYVLAAAAGRILTGNPQESANTAVNRFLQEMNAQAQALGMTGTHFDNPDGLQGSTHYTTPQDAVKIAQLALANPVIARCAATESDAVTYASGQMITWNNTNSLIRKDSVYYSPYAIGLKTGQTTAAGGCLLSAFRVEDRTVIIGVFGCPLGNSRFADILQLFNELLGTD